MTLNKAVIRGSAVVLGLLVACGDSGGGGSDETTASSASTGGGATDTGGATDEGSTADAPTSADTTAAPGSSTGETTAAPGTTGPGTTSEPGTTSDAPETTGGVADCGFDDGVVYGRLETVLQLVSADGETCVWLAREDLSEPDTIYKAVPFKLIEFKAGHAGGVDHLTDPARMSWESTHHNWTDVGEAWDDSVRYHLEDWYTKDGAFIEMYGLTAYDEATDALLWGPVELVPYAP